MGILTIGGMVIGAALMIAGLASGLYPLAFVGGGILSVGALSGTLMIIPINNIAARRLRVIEDKDFHAFVQKVLHNRGFNPSIEDLRDRQLHKIYLDTSEKLNKHNRSWITIGEEELQELMPFEVT